MFDKDILAKKVSQDSEKDLVKHSAVNFYENVNQHEAENFYNQQKDTLNPNPIEYGLNSKLVKENGTIKEEKWKMNGLYHNAIEKLYFGLRKQQPL
ncbi:MAG: dihydrofolate reductase, partial [Bacteroidales bacterium]|nr:dihydrofolate reductase [Bacteroidales bacterium]